MSNYYTPNINEFHIGFDFECKLNDGTWEKITFKPNSNNFDHRFREEAYFTEEGNTRVKYLDREDIESLGFSNTKYSSKNYFEKGDQTIIIEDFKDKLGLKLYVGFAGICPDCLEFNGYIKNKSELIKLLNQLDIL